MLENKEFQKGEIVTALTLVIIGFVTLGIFAGSRLVQQNTDISSRAQSTNCAVLSNVRAQPSSLLNPDQDFTCLATSSIPNSYTIACGWSHPDVAGGWPQTGGRWDGATCNGSACQFGIRMDNLIRSGRYELVAFDMRSECGASTGTRVALSTAQSTPPPSQLTNTPVPDQPTNIPVPGSSTPCSDNVCTDCILTNRADILPFYKENGHSVACEDQSKIVADWCAKLDPSACSNLKNGNCSTQCNTAPINTPTPTPTQVPTATPQTTVAPTPTPTAIPGTGNIEVEMTFKMQRHDGKKYEGCGEYVSIWLDRLYGSVQLPIKDYKNDTSQKVTFYNMPTGTYSNTAVLLSINDSLDYSGTVGSGATHTINVIEDQTTNIQVNISEYGVSSPDRLCPQPNLSSSFTSDPNLVTFTAGNGMVIQDNLQIFYIETESLIQNSNGRYIFTSAIQQNL